MSVFQAGTHRSSCSQVPRPRTDGHGGRAVRGHKLRCIRVRGRRPRLYAPHLMGIAGRCAGGSRRRAKRPCRGSCYAAPSRVRTAPPRVAHALTRDVRRIYITDADVSVRRASAQDAGARAEHARVRVHRRVRRDAEHRPQGRPPRAVPRHLAEPACVPIGTLAFTRCTDLRDVNAVKVAPSIATS